MKDLFDLPFEDEAREDAPAASGKPLPPSDKDLLPPADDDAPPLADEDLLLPTDEDILHSAGEEVLLPAEPAAAVRERRPARRVYTVGELTGVIRDLLEGTFAEVWVEGEISNCRVWTTGHLFFTLKDAGAQIQGVMFRSALRYLRFKPADGLRVIARGRVSIYEPKGEYQLVCEHLEPHGLGALQLAFDQLKKRLQDEGLFDAARKRRLPALPRKIGIVTSLDGAALKDIIKVLARRHPRAHLVIRPARVQGEGASAEIARGLRAIGRVPGVDVVIVGRGGGSIEDLWAFNEEAVARAIAASPVPVISAVGHEVDVTIADFVADVRAPTPSAAAEIVVAAKDEFCARIDRLGDRLRAAALARVQRLAARVHQVSARPALAGLPGRVALRGRRVADLAHDLARSVRTALQRRERQHQALRGRLEGHDVARRLERIRGRLGVADGRLRAAMSRAGDRARGRLQDLAGRLDSLSPLGVLARGYAVCWNAGRTAIISRADSVRPGDEVRITLHEGELAAEVKRSETP